MMFTLLVFFGGCTLGSLVTTVFIALCMAAKIGDAQLDAQQRWRDDVRRLLGEAL
jgi:hypothetical protein